jgi:hypothetical protein
MHRNWTWHNQEKPSGPLHRVDWQIVTGLESSYRQHHSCEKLNLTIVEANSTIFLQPHYEIFLGLSIRILSHFPLTKDMWISSVMGKALSIEASYQNLHAAVFMFVLVLCVLIL